MLRKWILFFFVVFFALAIPSGAKRLTRGFKIAKMRLEFPFRSDWEVEAELSVEKAKQILEKPFRYLNKGAQCYAFLSQDQRYVLKLFRFDQRHLFKKEKRSSALSQEFLKKSTRIEKISKFLDGCKLAATSAREDTGLLFLHLNQTSEKFPILNASGPLGMPLRLPLDEYRFALQKKAIPLAEGLIQAKAEAKVPERIEEIIALLERRIRKGIGNTDPSLWRNFGFLEKEAIEIDFGNYVPRPDFRSASCARAELERYMRPLRSWVEKYAPEYLADFNARVEGAEL